MNGKIKTYRQAIFKLDHTERKRDTPPSKAIVELVFPPENLAAKSRVVVPGYNHVTVFTDPLLRSLTASSAVQHILASQEGWHDQAEAQSSGFHPPFASRPTTACS